MGKEANGEGESWVNGWMAANGNKEKEAYRINH